jgi:hypothetical protein
MRRPPRPLGFLVLLTILTLLGVVVVAQADVAFTASYFDGQDEDLQLWILSQGTPAAMLIPVAPFPMLVVLTVVALLPHICAPTRTPQSYRLRAPPFCR